VLEHDFDDTLGHFIGALSHKLIQESYMLKTSQGLWLWMCFVLFI